MRTQIAMAAAAALLLAASASTALAPPPKSGPATGHTMLNPQPEPPNRHGHERDIHRCETPGGEYTVCSRALCRDRTTWQGTNRAEACMHHNGVERWL